VRLAALLTGDAQLADEVTQDSFVAWYSSASRLVQRDAGQARLLRLVVARSRLAVRRSAGFPGLGGQQPTAFADSPVVQALTALPHAQREAVVLTLYLELTEQEAANAVGVGLIALRRNLARGVHALGGMPLTQD
jgi:DNA-directed RNA polymerase specialized sigma24 family protein